MTRAENEREDAGNLFGKPVNWVRRKWVYSKTVNNVDLRDKCSHYRYGQLECPNSWTKTMQTLLKTVRFNI